MSPAFGRRGLYRLNTLYKPVAEMAADSITSTASSCTALTAVNAEPYSKGCSLFVFLLCPILKALFGALFLGTVVALCAFLDRRLISPQKS